jgi:hypothetical protein
MICLFTEEDSITHSQARYLRGGLWRNCHRVRVLRAFDRVPPADMWFHGLFYKTGSPFPEPVRCAMERFTGKIVFFQNDDDLSFALDKIPDSLRDRAALFLRNVWPANADDIHPSIRERTGLLNPFLKPCRAKAGTELICRPHRVSFFGAATGGGGLSRVKALRLLREAGVPFVGGLFNAPDLAPPPREFAADPLPKKTYLQTLGNTQLSLALHGNNPLSFRFFESFSRRCLVIAQDLGGIRFAGCGISAGRHYIAVKQDLSDLVDCVRYYLDHPAEAQAIANAGFAHFSSNFQFSGVDMSQPLYDEIVSSWKGVAFPQGRKTPFALAVRLLLPFIHSL